MWGGSSVCAVGVDTSTVSIAAAHWACENMVLGGHVHLVLVDAAAGSGRAYEELFEIAERCREHHPSTQITTELVPGHPVTRLVELSAQSAMLVLGSRGHGAFHDALLGSVALATTMRSACPTVLVRETPGPEPHGAVVTGVDWSDSSLDALEFAYRVAEHHGCELVAVQALPDAYFIPGPYEHPDRDELIAAAERRLAEQLAGFGPAHPEVVARRVTSNQNPVAALAEVAAHARLLVVGRRGRGGFAEMLMGSVSRGALHHAPCPVAVVPPRPVERATT